MNAKNEATTHAVEKVEKPKTNEATTNEAVKEKQPIKSIMQQLREKQEKEREQAIARNKERQEEREKEQQHIREKQEKEFRQKKELELTRVQQVFEKHLKDFEPIQIGEPDYKQSNQISNVYKSICGFLNQLKPGLIDYLKLKTFSNEILFEFIKSDPDKWLRQQYIEQNQIQITENLDVQKAIELELVHTPDTDILVALHKNIKNAWEKISSIGFIYPLTKLSDEETGTFDTNFDFYDEADEFLAIKTTTAEQNVIITILENLLESLYDLSDLRIIKLEKGPAELQRIESFLNYKAGAFTIKSNIFRHPALKQYFERPERNTQSAALNSFLQ